MRNRPTVAPDINPKQRQLFVVRLTDTVVIIPVRFQQFGVMLSTSLLLILVAFHPLISHFTSLLSRKHHAVRKLS